MLANVLFRMLILTRAGIAGAVPNTRTLYPHALAILLTTGPTGPFQLIEAIRAMPIARGLGGAFILIPWMNGLRDQALFAGLSVRESSNAVLFARLHAISSSVFLIQSLLGLLLVWRSSK